MIGPWAEKTLIGAIVPPDLAHINGVQSISFKNIEDLIFVNFISSSIIADFFVKSTGRTNLHHTWENLPLFKITSIEFVRSLVIVCLTEFYSELWEKCWTDEFNKESWAKIDSRLPNSFFHNLSPEWDRNCALRTDYARRQALVENDVLVSMALGLTRMLAKHLESHTYLI